MSLKRSNRPADKSNKTQRSTPDKNVSKQRITNTSRESNRNEEQVSPSGRGPATEQWNQMSQDRDRSTGRAIPPTERPDLAARQWNQGSGQRNERTRYTGNSERTGQQYSVTGNSSQIVDKDLKSGHPSNDRQKMQEMDKIGRAKSSDKGKKQHRTDSELHQTHLNKEKR